MNRSTIFVVFGTTAWLLAAPQLSWASDAVPTSGSSTIKAPPALVLVPEPRPAPMPAQAAKAPVMPSVPSAAAPAAPPTAFYVGSRPVASEVLPPLLSGRSHKVAPGESLDRVIQKTMADSPLKPEAMRQAFIQLNPQAFPDGRMARLKTGTVLQVPDSAQLLRSVLLPVLEGAEAAAVVRSGTPQAADERRRWVRFP